MNKVQLIPRLTIVLLIFLLGGLAGWYFFKPRITPPEESGAVLLEKIQTVCKLVTVEGEFSELYSHNAYSGYFTFFWDKKMLMRVRAKVSVGYDMDKMKLESNPLTKTIKISQLPEPQILSIDHTVDYYDVSEGIFTSFTPQEYTQINERAKELIRQEALKSSLLPAAKNQGNQIIDIVRIMVKEAGWQMEVEEVKR